MNYSKKDLIKQLKDMGIKNNDTLKVHLSYKAIHPTTNGPDTVIDALMDYLEEGLLVIPTHTWGIINEKNPIYDPLSTKSNIGIIPNLFLERKDVYRSLHPTHSVAAYGKNALDFIKGEEVFTTPCPRDGVYGKLFDKHAKILLVGVTLNRNTYFHGVEEWIDIKNRVTDFKMPLKILKDNKLIDAPLSRHTPLNVADNYNKTNEILFNLNVLKESLFGNAKTLILDAYKSKIIITKMLEDMPDLFLDDKPLSQKQINYYSNLNYNF